MSPSIAHSVPSSPSPIHSLPSTKSKSQINVNIVELAENSDETDSDSEIITSDHLDPERARLRRHLGLDLNSTNPAPYYQNYNRIEPLFFIERAPGTKIPIKCSLPGCTAEIKYGSLRLALNPGMNGDTWFRSSSDYYHIPCFELLCPLTTSTPYLSRLLPLTRNTYPLRGLKPSSVTDGTYLLPGGAERLLLEWKLRRGIALDKRDGVFDPARYDLDPEIRDLMYRSGERGFWPAGRPNGLDVFEYFTLARTVAANEVDAEGEFSLFEEFLGEEGLESEGRWGMHDFSELLERWERSVNAAWKDGVSQDVGTHITLRPTAIRAIKRLSTIPAPQVGYNRLYS